MSEANSKLIPQESHAKSEKSIFNIVNDQTWFTSNEVAEYLRISVSAVHNLTSSGKLPYCKLGSRNRYRREDLDELLLQNRRGVYK